MRDPKLDENHYILSPLPRVSARWARAGECHFWVIRVALDTLAERRSSPNSDQTGDPPGQSKSASSGRTDSHYRTSAEPRGALLPQLDDLATYLGVDGMAEEWWSQRSPFLT